MNVCIQKHVKRNFQKRNEKFDAICGHIKLFYSWHEYFVFVLNTVGNSVQICYWKNICLIIIFTSRSEAFKWKALYHLNILIYLFKCVYNINIHINNKRYVLWIQLLTFLFYLLNWLSKVLMEKRDVKVCAMQTKPEIQKFHSIFFFFISSNMR